ncbi:sulfotransferase family protein [Limnofasciculus baicalensis]|uniref:Sulfotransferase n=1 Tax=Limnofasciculus baicalensis BBK-W-15 TaxID=2699891 RepID=A0AAE3KN18_9CYAN|nr:sulfotransferase [Limnofasciculus baicalensis]MCP2729839.1 sulfotransferase [Limnofasciculus baicalensis BBK-W-15]
MNNTLTRLNEKVYFICGVGHSGSTLLGLILGSHSDCFYCGEAAKSRFLHDPNKPIKKRVCKICGFDCRVWGDLNLTDSLDLYEQVSRKTEKPIMIDSTKNLEWLEEQLTAIARTTAQPFLIFLQRDGRAVLNSRIRKYPDKDIKELIESWRTQIQLTKELFQSFEHKKIKIRYEELATQPETVTRNLCDFLEIDYQPEMLHYYQQEHHPLGGNDGTQFLVTKAQTEKIKEPIVSLSEKNSYYYQDRSLGISLDLRWMEELDPNSKRLFEEIVGQENEEMKWGF